MSKNFYVEEYSGNFDSFDYNLNAEINGDGTGEICAYINHSRINFNNMVSDFKSMLSCLRSHFELSDYNFVSSEVINPEDKAYEISINPTESEITVQIFGADFKQDSLVQSFAYAIGYIQSFLLHGEVISDGEEKDESN